MEEFFFKNSGELSELGKEFWLANQDLPLSTSSGIPICLVEDNNYLRLFIEIEDMTKIVDVRKDL